MYPYSSSIKWLIRPRQKHLVDALEDREDAFTGPDGLLLKARLRAIEGWLKARAALIVLLGFSAVAAVVSWAIDIVGGFAAVTAVVELVRNITTTASGVLSLLYVFVLRTLGQLEIDAILLMPAHRAHWDGIGTGTPSPTEKPSEGHAVAVAHPPGSWPSSSVPLRVRHRPPMHAKRRGRST